MDTQPNRLIAIWTNKGLLSAYRRQQALSLSVGFCIAMEKGQCYNNIQNIQHFHRTVI